MWKKEEEEWEEEEEEKEKINISSRSVVTCTIIGFARDRICHVRDTSSTS